MKDLPTKILQSLPFATQVLLPVLNLWGERSVFVITVTSPDYVCIKVLWELISYEKGEKIEFKISGTQAYVNALLSALEKKQLRVIVR